MSDLQSYRCFVELARSARFKTAARRCHLSPNAFSERIRRLEEHLGEALFERTTRSVALSSAGQRLLPLATQLLAQEEACLHSVKERGTAPYELTIGTRFELGLSWVVPALPRLEKAAPERTLHLAFGSGRELVARTRAGELDAFISSMRLSQAELEHEPLHEERYVFVGAPALMRVRPITRASDGEAHCLIDIDGELPLFRYLREAGDADWRFGRQRHAGTIAAMAALVQAGQGVAVLPEYFARAALARGQLKKLMPRAPLLTDVFRLSFPARSRQATRLLQLASELRRIPLA